LQFFSTTSRFTQPWARSRTGPLFYRLGNGKTLAFHRAFHNNECKYESFLFMESQTMITTTPALPPAIAAHPVAAQAVKPVKRISSASLMDGGRELEIEHGGRVYRLRITQLNKLILTA
jgi:hemin uptake protein HemP